MKIVINDPSYTVETVVDAKMASFLGFNDSDEIVITKSDGHHAAVNGSRVEISVPVHGRLYTAAEQHRIYYFEGADVFQDQDLADDLDRWLDQSSGDYYISTIDDQIYIDGVGQGIYL